MFIGVLLGAVGAKLGGTGRMLYVAPVVGLAAGLEGVATARRATGQRHRYR
jgi:hypothetical protein